jgi:hypothetical protein
MLRRHRKEATRRSDNQTRTIFQEVAEETESTSFFATLAGFVRG